MEEVERVAHEKYKIIKEQMKNADNETIAILMAINSLSTQLEREIQVEDMEKELETLRAKQLEQLKVKATATNDDEDDPLWLGISTLATVEASLCKLITWFQSLLPCV